jgi:hypothetical protein
MPERVTDRGTTDELPEEVGGRRVRVHVEDSRVMVEIDDPDLADLVSQALALRPAEAQGEALSGEAPAAASFSGIWAAVRNSAGDVFLRLAAGRASSRGAARRPGDPDRLR